MNRRCKSCNDVIPPKRVELLPHVTHCVNCSTEDKVSAVPVIHHKTGNEIQIVRDPEVAAEFHRLASRVGYGTLRGLKAGVSGDSVKKRTEIKAPSPIRYEASIETYNKLGERVMKEFDLLGIERAKRTIREAVETRLISSYQGSSLNNILEALLPSSNLESKPVVTKYIPKDIRPKQLVSDEIEMAFKHWKKY